MASDVTNCKLTDIGRRSPKAVFGICGLALVFTALAMVALRSLFFECPFVFRFRLVGDASRINVIDSSIYYMTDADRKLSERQRIRIAPESISSEGFCSVELPSSVTGQFRLDLKSKDEESLAVVPVEVLTADGAKTCELNVHPKNRRWISNYFEASECRFWRFSFPLFGSWFCVFYLIAFAFARYVLHLVAIGFAGNLIRGLAARWRSVSFVLGFMLLILLPSASLNHEKISVRENRGLARFPDPSGLRTLGISKWCGEFGAAFEDRFFGREAMMDVHDAVRSVFDDRGNDKVLIGRGGWFFLRESLGDFANVAELDETEYVVLRDRLKSFAAYAQRRGKLFIFLVAPDKCRVYPEYMRFLKKLRPDSESRTERIVARLRRECDFPVIYPRSEMVRQGREMARPLYFKGDTHWTGEGAYAFGYLPIMKAIMRERGLGIAPRMLEPGDVAWKNIRYYGDLSRMLQRDKDVLDPQEYGCPDLSDENVKRKSRGTYPRSQTVATCSNGKSSLFCMGDSFLRATALVNFLEKSFRSSFVKFIWDGVRAEDLSRIEASDVVLVEVVERHLLRIGKLPMPAQIRQEVK